MVAEPGRTLDECAKIAEAAGRVLLGLKPGVPSF